MPCSAKFSMTSQTKNFLIETSDFLKLIIFLCSVFLLDDIRYIYTKAMQFCYGMEGFSLQKQTKKFDPLNESDLNLSIFLTKNVF